MIPEIENLPYWDRRLESLDIFLLETEPLRLDLIQTFKI